jgi:hypothetical protein
MNELTYDNYREVLEYDYQQEDKQPKTFLQIARQPHYENVISNILAFFFDTSEEHLLKDLFLQSLVHLINKKGHDYKINDCYCIREYGKRKSGRIDLLLVNSFEDKVIIVENKINHYLANDLGNYYKSVKKDFPKAEITGVVLSLEPLNTGNDKFVSVSHKKFVDEVQKRLGNYYLNGSDKYLLLLKDYIQNIHLNYPSEKMKDKIHFYHLYHKKVYDMAALQNEIFEHLGSEIKKGGDRFNYKYSDHASDKLYYWEFLDNKSPINEQYFYTIDLTELNSELMPLISIFHTFGYLDKKLLKTVFKEKGKLEKKYPNFHFSEATSDNSWVDFAWRSYELSEQNMLNLTDFLYDVVQKDFEPLKDELLTILTATKK